MRTPVEVAAAFALLVPLCHGLVVTRLGDLPALPATIGRTELASRAVYCDKNGFFTRLQAIYDRSSYTATLEVCCSTGSRARYEGDGGTSPQQCLKLGAGSVSSSFKGGTLDTFSSSVDGLLAAGAPGTGSTDVQTASCGVDAITAIGYADAAFPSQSSDLPTEQLCSAGAACGLGTSLVVGCADTNFDGLGAPVSAQGARHACAAGEIVQALYARWDGRSVQAMDGVRCRKIYTRPAPEVYGPLLEAAPTCGAPAATWQDVRCQGFAADYCGCLAIPTAAAASFYGCVLSGSAAAAPLYTLPGVLEAQDASDPDRCRVAIIEESVGTGQWETFRNAADQSKCLAMSAASQAVSEAACTQDSRVLPGQRFKRVSVPPGPGASAIDALEPAVAPGICVFNTPTGIFAQCSCAALALGQCKNDVDGVIYDTSEQFTPVIGPYVAGYSDPSSDLTADAQNIATILSQLAAVDGNLGSQLGAPPSRQGDLGTQLAENPHAYLDWAGVVRGGPSGIIQLLVQPFGGSTSAKLAPELLSLPGLLGLRIANAANMVGELPSVSPSYKIVALEVSNTPVTGTVPRSWGLLPDLDSLTLHGTALSGPLHTAFVDTEATRFLIQGNTGATFCGSGDAGNALSAALPVCSQVAGIPAGSFFVNAVLQADAACESIAPGIQSALERRTAHFVQITSVTCTTYADDVPAGRRMLRTARSLLQDDAASQLVEVVYAGPDSSFGQLESATVTAAAQVEAEDPNVLGLEPSEERPARNPRGDPDADPPAVDEPEVPTPDTPATEDPQEPVTPNPEAAPSAQQDEDAAREREPAGDEGDDSGSSVGGIVGGIAGALTFLVLGCLFWFCCWKKHSGKDKVPARTEMAGKPKETSSTRVNVDARYNVQQPPPPAHGTPLKDSANRAQVKTGYRTERAQEMSPAITPLAGVGTLPGNLSDTSLGTPYEHAHALGDPVSGTASSMTRSGSMDSDKILPKIRVSGSSRSVTRVPAVPLPSSSNNYPLSAECSRLSSREIHRRMRSASLRSAGKNSNETSGETEDGKVRDAAADAAAVGSAAGAAPEGSKRAVAAATGATMAAGALVVAAADGYDEDSGAPALAVVPQYAVPAPYTGGQDAQVSNPTEPQMVDSPRALGGLVRENSITASSVASGTVGDSGSLVSRGIRLRTTRRPSSTLSMGGPDSPDDFTQRLGDSFATSVIVNSRALSARSGSSLTGAALSDTSLRRGGDTSRMSVDHSGLGMTQVFGMSQTVGVSAWATASVLSDGTTVYTDIGGIEMDDAIASMEALLNRCQTELEGQVGSYRLQGPRHRFAGRTSVVAFADGMWGGQFALKFYCEPDAANREFAIYKKATELNMVLPPVQELEDNAGGVFRLKDGTPLPPHLAMPRGLPLPEWYAVHQPSQLAILECLAQSLHRLEQLHLSGYCHNDVKPANIILLESPNEREPRWHIVDFTAVAQSGDQVRARYTLEYASPELVHAVNSMRANYVTCQNSMDIWSMGVIMYEVITAEPFFPIDADRDAMRDGLVGLEPLPFEEDRRSLLRVPEEGGLRDVVLAMLSREPTMRPTAATVGRALRQCIRDLTGDSPERLDASPVSSIGGMDTSQEMR